MNGTCLSTSLCYVVLVYVECGIFLPYSDGPSRNRRNNNIADEHRCFPSQERDGQLEEIVVLNSFIGQLYQSFVWMFIYSVYNICRDMNELLIMGCLLWPLFIMLFSYTSAIKPPYIYVCKIAKVSCMETTIPSAGCDVLFTRGISASTL